MKVSHFRLTLKWSLTYLFAGLQTMFWGCRHQPRWKNIRRQVFRVRGQVKCQCLYATISFWSVLRLFEIERTGMQKYCLDFRMCSTKTSCKNWQLYSYPLKKGMDKRGFFGRTMLSWIQTEVCKTTAFLFLFLWKNR